MTSNAPFFESDYVAVEPSNRVGWYEVRAFRPDAEGGLVIHEARSRTEANIFAGRLATIIRKWHNEAPPSTTT